MVTILSKAGKKSFGLEGAEWKWRHSQSQSGSLLWIRSWTLRKGAQIQSQPAVLALGHVAIKCALIHRLLGPASNLAFTQK